MDSCPRFMSLNEFMNAAIAADLGGERSSTICRHYQDFLRKWQSLLGVINSLPEESRTAVYGTAWGEFSKLSFTSKQEPIWPYELYEEFVLSNYGRITREELTEEEGRQIRACAELYTPASVLYSNAASTRFKKQVGTLHYGKLSAILQRALGQVIRDEASHTVLRRLFSACLDANHDLFLSGFVYNKKPALDLLACLVEMKLTIPGSITWDVIGLIRFHHRDKVGRIIDLLPPALIVKARGLFAHSDRSGSGLTQATAEKVKARAS